MKSPVFTVFTPTYNRADLLPRVYDSLLLQDFKDFEWLIVDDGSSDNTAELVAGWRERAPFNVRYDRKENGGKHSALNHGVKEAEGRYFVVIDSDDWLLPTALMALHEGWNSIGDAGNIVAVVGLFSYDDGCVVGTKYPADRLVSNPIDLRYRWKVQGDKIGAQRTEILRKFPFPDHLGRAYVSESLIWNRIAQEYDSVFINTIIGVKQYQPGGITYHALLNDKRNPLAGRMHASELLTGVRKIPLELRFKTVARFVKCSIYGGRNPLAVAGFLDRLMLPFGLIAAVGLIARDSIRAKRGKTGMPVAAPVVHN